MSVRYTRTRRQLFELYPKRCSALIAPPGYPPAVKFFERRRLEMSAAIRRLQSAASSAEQAAAAATAATEAARKATEAVQAASQPTLVSMARVVRQWSYVFVGAALALVAVYLGTRAFGDPSVACRK